MDVDQIIENWQPARGSILHREIHALPELRAEADRLHKLRQQRLHEYQALRQRLDRQDPEAEAVHVAEDHRLEPVLFEQVRILTRKAKAARSEVTKCEQIIQQRIGQLERNRARLAKLEAEAEDYPYNVQECRIGWDLNRARKEQSKLRAYLEAERV